MLWCTEFEGFAEDSKSNDFRASSVEAQVADVCSFVVWSDAL